MSLMKQAGTILKKAGSWCLKKTKESFEGAGDTASTLALRSSFRLQNKQQDFMRKHQQKWLAFQAEAQRENRGIQLALQERQLRIQAELQKRQQAFQVALQERNYQLMGQLQREMAMIKFEMDYFLQKSNFENQIAMWERTEFMRNVWPLIDTPQNIVDRLEEQGSPLSVILSGAADGAYDGMLGNAADFFNSTYIGESLVYYYNQGWKQEMRDRDGNAQRDAIHQAMKGLPTLLLLPIYSEGNFELRIAFWGWGDMALPQTQKVFSINVKKLNMQILRELSLEWKDLPFPPNPTGRMKTIQENLAIAKEEEEYREKLRQKGYSEEKVESMCSNVYSDRYSLRDLGDDLVRERNNILSAPLKITAAMISDAYNLGGGILPKLPGYMKELSDDMRQMFWPQVESFFEDFLQSQNDLDRPLTQTLLARSCAAAERPDLAEKYRQEAIHFLTKAYSSTNKPTAEEHWKAILMLREDGRTNFLPNVIEPTPIPELLPDEVPPVNNPEREPKKKPSIDIFSAIQTKNLRVVREWIDFDSEVVNTTGRAGQTPLHYAAKNNALKIMELLLENDADVDAEDDIERTPLHYAAASGTKRTVRVLVEAGADVDAQDEDGDTPLHHAVYSNDDSVEIISYLLDHGADKTIENDDDETPYDVAEDPEEEELLDPDEEDDEEDEEDDDEDDDEEDEDEEWDDDDED